MQAFIVPISTSAPQLMLLGARVEKPEYLSCEGPRNEVKVNLNMSNSANYTGCRGAYILA